MDDPGWLVFAMAVFTGITFLWFGWRAASRPATDGAKDEYPESDEARIQIADDARERTSPVPRYIVAGVGFVIAAALLAHLISAAVGYAILCLALVQRCVADQISEERAPRRRSALLGRSRAIDPVLASWIALAAIASLFLIPWIFDEAVREAAIVVAICAAAMLVVAWRIASAPPLLFGNDLKAEQVVDRETRAIRTGNTCFLTVAAVVTFVGFSGDSAALHYRGDIVLAMLVLSFGLYAWSRIHARRLARTPLAS
jgi:hypothetical protein